MSSRLSSASTNPQIATPVNAAPPIIAIQAPVSNSNPPVLLPAGAGACGAGLGGGAGAGVGRGVGALEATSAKDAARTPSFKLISISWPFIRTKDSEVFVLRTVTLPLIVRTPAAVEPMIAMLPAASSLAVISN